MLKKIVSVLLVLIMLVSMNIVNGNADVYAAAAGTGYYNVNTTAGSLRIRADATTSSKQLGTVPNGAKVNVTQVSGDWGKITYNGITGWISLNYAIKAGSAGESPTKENILSGLDALRKKFPDGKYWNHYGSSKKNLDGWTETPCPSGHYLNGVQQCNGQCDGFARKLGLDLFGLSTYSWEKTSYNINTICVGDLIRYNSKHTIMVIGFTEDPNYLVIADCNWDYHCVIRWDALFSTSRYFRNVNWVLHYPGNNLTRAEYFKTDVKINYADYIVCEGGKFNLTASVSPSSQASTLKWKSSDTSVAKVDAKGNVTAVGEGTAKITASAGTGSAVCEVTVTDAVSVKRLYGENRMETAIKVSDSGWSSGAENVILANGYSYADALAGVPLSKALDAPILLTNNSESGLEKEITAQIKKLGAKNIYILGGTYVVSEKIEKSLKNAGYNIIRLWGADRFDTSVEIAKKLSELTGASGEIFFANGYGFADTLSASSIAAIRKSPIIFVLNDGSIKDSAKEYIKTTSSKKANIIGGTGVVPDALKKVLEKCGVTEIERFSGMTRYDTCLAVIDAFNAEFKGSSIAIATGRDFPDALAGGALAAKLGIPLILSNNDVKPTNEMQNWLKKKDAEKMYVFGGEYAVNNRTMYFYTV